MSIFRQIDFSHRSEGLVLFRLISAGVLSIANFPLPFVSNREEWFLSQRDDLRRSLWIWSALFNMETVWSGDHFPSFFFFSSWNESLFKDNHVHIVHLEPYFAFDVLKFLFTTVLKEIR